MSERSAKLRTRCVRQVARAAGIAAAGALVLWSSAHPTARAQTYPPVVQRYLSNGADMTTVPEPGEPGSAWYSSGADTTRVPEAGQPGAEYFSSGADATSTRRSPAAEAYYSRGADVAVAQPGTPAGDYYSRGADSTSAKPGTVADQYFSQGAEVTHVPRPGQFGAEYYSQGADATNISRWYQMPVLQQTPVLPKQEAGRAAPSEVENAPEEAPPSAESGAEEGAAESVEAPDAGAEQAAAPPPGQEPPSPGDGRAIETPTRTGLQATTPAPASTPFQARPLLDVIASYTLASMVALFAVPLFVLLVAFGGRAYARRHA